MMTMLRAVVSGLRVAPRLDHPGSDRLVQRDEAIALPIPDQHDVADAQRVLEDEQEVAARDRTARCQAHGALDPRVDRVAHAQDVAEDDLGDRRHRRVLEVQFVAVAVRRALRTLDAGKLGAAARGGAAAVVTDGPSLLADRRVRIGRIGKARQQIEATDTIDRIAGTLIVEIARRERRCGRHEACHSHAAANREPAHRLRAPLNYHPRGGKIDWIRRAAIDFVND
jgi:hypothetical protein